jgi:hypothetical protein
MIKIVFEQLPKNAFQRTNKPIEQINFFRIMYPHNSCPGD